MTSGGPLPGALAPGLLTATAMLEWRRSRAGLPAFDLPEGVLLTHQGALLGSLASRLRTRPVRGLSGEVRILGRQGRRLAVAGNIGVGAPATAVLVEELAVAGVREIVAVDIAASLDPSLPSGTVVLARDAVCADGTSPHYVGGQTIVSIRDELGARLAAELALVGLPARDGRVWSTDAPYRETPALIAAYRHQGATLVDMETAAFLAVAAALRIGAAAVLVVADELFDGWKPPADAALLQARLRLAAEAAKACLLA